MNHKKATPAKGTRFNASATVLESVASHAPGSSGSDGTERQSSQIIANRRAEKAMPAIAAAFGVFRRATERAPFSDITGSILKSERDLVSTARGLRSRTRHSGQESRCDGQMPCPCRAKCTIV